MKKAIYILLTLVSFGLISCNFSSGKISITTKEDLQKAKQIMVNKFGSKTEFLELVFTTENVERLVFEQGIYQNNSEYITYTYEYDNVLKKPSMLSEKQKSFKPLTLDDFNVDEFIEIKNKAIALIEEKSKDFNNFKIKEITCSIKENSERRYHFEIIGLKISGKISYVGDKITYLEKPYYKFVFTYDTDIKKLKTQTQGFD